jgi:DNA-binding PadR family transcriptional regulator
MHRGFFGFEDCFPDFARRARWGFEGLGTDFFWGGKGGHRGRPFRGRFFEQGDLKYVILRLLAEKPRHGYDIIKDLEERFGGSYAPSPGTVYPTLTMLEDLGFARARDEEGGKKIYEITDEGRKHLAEHSDTVDDIFEKISRFVHDILDAPMMQVNHAFRNVGRATYGKASSSVKDKELLARIKEILDKAAAEIDALGK